MCENGSCTERQEYRWCIVDNGDYDDASYTIYALRLCPTLAAPRLGHFPDPEAKVKTETNCDIRKVCEDVIALCY